MICPHCQAQNGPDDRFFANCGGAVAESVPGSAARPNLDTASLVQVKSGAAHTLARKAVIGRHADCDLTLDDSSVSREHARIVRLTQGHIVEDLGSTNGTRVNGRKIDETVVLHSGDTLQIGAVELRYELGSA